MGVIDQALYFAVHPFQLTSIIQWKIWHKPAYTRDPSKESATLRDCFKWLKLTSRSFAMVVQELNPELVVPVAMYYLVLRGLDTIEDDMSLPLEEKEPLLRSFESVLDKDGWTFDKNGPHEKDRELLVHFDDVITEFQLIDSKYKDIIKDITHKMGNGMADFAHIAEVNTIKEYELYCHYVAGLVGDGLTGFFLAGDFADANLRKRPELSESMGQFLQKTNIIRDVREDFDDRRRFWPKEIWSKYVGTFDDLFDPQNRKAALACNSEMVLNALVHSEECLSYMASIKEPGVFAFVAIPQAMAIATLELVFQNPRMFETNVKITRGDSAELIMEATQNLRTVCAVFKRYVRRISRKNNPKDPNFVNISLACARIEQFIESLYPLQQKGISQTVEGIGRGGRVAGIDGHANSNLFHLVLAMLGLVCLFLALMMGIWY